MSIMSNKTAKYVEHEICSCPSCFSTDTKEVGTLYLDGCPAAAFSCLNCSTMFPDNRASVKAFVSSITSAADKKTYIPKNTNLSNVGVTSPDTSATLNVEDSRVASEISGLKCEIQNLNTQLSTLMGLIEDVVMKNEELMKDPLRGLKSKVFDFNLK